MKDDNYSIFLCGVPKYKNSNISQLPFCANDVSNLKQIFIENYAIPESRIAILGSDPKEIVERSQVLRTIKYVSENADKNGAILFYYSGHGTSIEKESYITASDTEIDLLEDTAISIKRIQSEFNKSQAKLKIFIIDSCYSGISLGKPNDVMSSEFENALNDLVKEGWIIFASCKGTERSYSTNDNSMSVFTHYLINGLKGGAAQEGEAFVSFDSLVSYVTGHVTKWALESKTSQTPNIKGELVGKIKFTLSKKEIISSVTTHEAAPAMKIDKVFLHNSYTAPKDNSFELLTTISPSFFGGKPPEKVKYTESERNEMANSRSNELVEYFFTELIKHYAPTDTKRVGYTFDLPFGKFEIQKSTGFYSAVLQIDAVPTSGKAFDFLKSIDSQKNLRWHSLTYQVDRVFNFDKVNKISQDNGYEIKKYNPLSSEFAVEIPVSKTRISFINSNKSGRIIFFKDSSLPEEFFDSIPTSEIIQKFTSSLE